MPTLHVDGVKLHYEVSGSGAGHLILAHAYPTNRTLWAPQVEALARSRTVVAYDMRGFGLSDAPDRAEAYSTQQSVADLLALVDRLGAARVDICGLSMGGNIALNFALDHPQRVSSLIISGTGAGSNDAAAFAGTTHAWAAAAEGDGMEAFANLILANPIFAEFSDRGPVETTKLRSLIMANSVAGVTHTARQVLAKRQTINELAPRMRGLPVRTLVVIGAKDVACIPPSEVMTGAIPGARRVVIPGTGHFNNLEEPAALNDVIHGFLAEST